MAQRLWTRDETLIALNLYCRTPFGRLHARNPEIVSTARELRRTPSSLAMKCCNLAALDRSLHSRGIAGLKKTSKMDREVWSEFERTPEEVAFQAEEAFSRISNQPLRLLPRSSWETVEGMDRVAITKVRVNQHFFRSLILTGYRSKCAICELPFSTMLVASHIVPWVSGPELRMNPRNGICLCSLHDRAFDRGLLHVTTEYVIQVHATVHAHKQFESVAANFLRYCGRPLKLPDRWLPDPELLKRRLALTPTETLAP